MYVLLLLYIIYAHVCVNVSEQDFGRRTARLNVVYGRDDKRIY